MQLRFNDKYCENSKHEKIRENKMVLLWFTVIHCEFTGKVTKIQNIKKKSWKLDSWILPKCYALWFNEKYFDNSKHKKFVKIFCCCDFTRKIRISKVLFFISHSLIEINFRLVFAFDAQGDAATLLPKWFFT